MGYVKEQIRVIKERDPAIKTSAEVFLYPSFYALLFHKWGHWFYKKKHFFIARLISQIGRGLTGIEIHPGAIIGKGLFIDHGMGVVIGETCEIGDNVTIYHGVTLGGTGKDHGKRHPTIGNNVMISTGAKVLGPFKVGDNSRIAANAVVLQEIPEDSTVVGIPGKVVRIQGKRINPCEDLDQVKLPDPVKMEICTLRRTVEGLEEQLKSLEHQMGLSDKELKAMKKAVVLDESPEIYVSPEFCERMQQTEFIRQPNQHRCEDENCENKEACNDYQEKNQ
ncbi:serine O-acetyltransferase EpsC [Cellulosilyticum sp. ST5]|uniref:serine O-acetyltransferase EpsC n=1 Tax=Cellulosilyticum sp. ST5 TaxID=3055805 RepID=UPI003977AE95